MAVRQTKLEQKTSTRSSTRDENAVGRMMNTQKEEKDDFSQSFNIQNSKNSAALTRFQTMSKAKVSKPNIIILINGLWGPAGGIKSPLKKYWGEDWVNDIKAHWGDQKVMFFDGSLGGQTNLHSNMIKSYRIVEGEKAGYANAAKIIGQLAEGETIKFVTNSMGAAYQRGFSAGLRKYILERQVSILKEQSMLRKVVDNASNRQRRRFEPEMDKVNLKGIQTRLKQLQAEYTKLDNVKVEIVVDIEPHQKTMKDPYAQDHYFLLSDKTDYNWFERNFLSIKPVEGAINASKKNGQVVTTGHHSSWTDVYDLPKPQKK